MTHHDKGEGMGTELFRRVLANAHMTVDPEGLVRVWSMNPWMVNAFTGRVTDDRDNAMRAWCRESMGDETWPFGREPRQGRWQRGTATIHGWTWFGFQTEQDLRAFEAAWPPPPNEVPDP